MLAIDYISRTVEKLVRKYQTRDPYELCGALDVRIRYKDLGSCMAYYFTQSRVSSIILNYRVAEHIRRILIAHELGHDRLHHKIATKGFYETTLFDMVLPTEYEANIFASDLLIEDGELLELLSEENKSFYDVACSLDVPAAFLDFKLRVFKHKGYSVEPLYIANGDFLKGGIDGCFVEEHY